MKEIDCISRKQTIERLKLNLPISQGADNPRDRHRYMQAMADIQAIREMPSVTPQLSSELEKNSKKLDCISRADAIRVASGYCHPSNVAKELAKLPSVTPQEPKTGHWILDETDNSITCDKCGCLIWANDISNGEAYFCPNCGARMVEPQESEVKDEEEF